jgi:hypothetical protein
LFTAFFKSIGISLVLAATLLTSPLFFFVILANNLIFNSLSFYTIILFAITASLFEYNVLIKRLYPIYSGAKVMIYITIGNLISYGLALTVINNYLFWCLKVKMLYSWFISNL